MRSSREPLARRRLRHHVVWMLTAAAVLWVVLLWSSPFARHAAGDGLHARVARLTYAAGARLCHQEPARSFWRGADPLPVCGRCTGLYLGGALGLLGAARRRPGLATPRRYRSLLTIAAIPTGLTVLGEWAGVDAIGNLTRATAALPLGSLAGWMLGTAASAAAATASTAPAPGLHGPSSTTALGSPGRR